jgi:hypothetical protein
VNPGSGVFGTLIANFAEIDIVRFNLLHLHASTLAKGDQPLAEAD